MGNSHPSIWAFYARDKTTSNWIPDAIWGYSESETHNKALIRSYFRHEVYRYALGSHVRFKSIYLYQDGWRICKVHLLESVLEITFLNAEAKTTWLTETREDVGTLGGHRNSQIMLRGRFNEAWIRNAQDETLITIVFSTSNLM